MIVKHKHNLIYNQTLLAPPQEASFESSTDHTDEHLNEDNVYNMLISHVKSFVPNAKYLKAADVHDPDQLVDTFNGLQDESLFSRFHLPYVTEDRVEEEKNLKNIQKLLASLDEDQETKSYSLQPYSSSFKGRFNIDSYMLDCTSLEQIFMSLLHVSPNQKKISLDELKYRIND